MTSFSVPPGFSENYSHWVKRHCHPDFLPAGCPAIEIAVGEQGPHHALQCWLLPSGATFTTNSLDSQKTRDEPPTDEKRRLEARRLYLSSRLRTAESGFTRLRNALRSEVATKWQRDAMPELRGAGFSWDSNEWGVEPSPGTLRGETSLLRLRQIVSDYRRILNAVVKKYDQLEEVIAERKAEREAAEAIKLRDQRWAEQDAANYKTIDEIEIEG